MVEKADDIYTTMKFYDLQSLQVLVISTYRCALKHKDINIYVTQSLDFCFSHIQSPWI